MTNESIHAALWEWFARCAEITRLFFNFSGENDGDTAIATSGDTLIEEFIGGMQRRRYAFELIRFLPLTTEANDPGNVEMMDDVERVIHWVRTQNEAGSFPRFPEGCAVESIDVLETSTGYVAATDESMAKYMIPFAIEYMKG